MKKITLLFLFVFGLLSFGYAQVSQNFAADGADSDPTVLTIESTDITVNGSDPITAISLGDFTSHYNGSGGSTEYCGVWYDFDLAVVGGISDGTSISAGCDVDFNGMDVTGFTTITITSNNIDNFPDIVYFDIDLDVTFTVSSAPACDAVLTETVNTGVSGNISWSEATGQVDNYDVTVGTASGLSDVYFETLGNVLTTEIGALLNGTTYYVTITPSNFIGAPTDCAEQSFTTVTLPDNDNCANAIALTPGGVFADNPVDGTVAGATADAEAASCGSDGSGVWYSVIVPASGDITFEVGPDSDTGTTTFDSVIEAFTGTCGALTSIDCDDDGAATASFSELSLTGLVAGEIVYFRVWEYGGDEVEAFSVSAFNATLSVGDFENEAAFTYYPNPVKNTLTLNAKNTIEQVAMYNMLGQEVLRANPNTLNSNLDMSTLQTGTYFVKVTIGNVTETIRVMKQ
ncbi:T9SS type A sorting domain-containing protein [Winogradskyella wichelsiae]|uniref:T9SS type A sorting domain-containing protein n=1 Tax=Winogradskyella wichelsiae TaxID=2697007 RepID=UPI0015CBAB7E|nr:T9SS type A sorting domain-containing protein [Winogradskyella wichelsiae]